MLAVPDVVIVGVMVVVLVLVVVAIDSSKIFIIKFSRKNQTNSWEEKLYKSKRPFPQFLI